MWAFASFAITELQSHTPVLEQFSSGYVSHHMLQMTCSFIRLLPSMHALFKPCLPSCSLELGAWELITTLPSLALYRVHGMSGLDLEVQPFECLTHLCPCTGWHLLCPP